MAIVKIAEIGNPSNNSELEFYIETPEILAAYFAEKKMEQQYETTYEIYTVKNKSETLSMLTARFKSVLTGKALEEEIVLMNSLEPNSDGEYVLLQERQLAIPIKREVGMEISFEPIGKIPLEKEVYLIIETNNFRRKTIQTYIVEGGEMSSRLGRQQSLNIIDNQGQSQQFVEARVGAWSLESNAMNKEAFRDWAISSVRLPRNHFSKEKNIHLLVDAFSANEYFNQSDNRIEKLDHRGESSTRFGIENLWFEVDDEPFELMQ